MTDTITITIPPMLNEPVRAFLAALTECLAGSAAATPVPAPQAQPSPAPDMLTFPGDQPPTLTFSRPTSVVLDGRRLTKGELYWNRVLFLVAHMASKKLDKHTFRQNTLVYFEDGQTKPEYEYIPDADISLQGSDANRAWKAAYRLAKAANIPLEVTFRWADSEGAFRPGMTAHIAAP